MSEEDLERFETEMELQLYQEYRDVLPLFSYVVETERRFYLANSVEVDPPQPPSPDGSGGRTHFELRLRDAWVWDIYRPGPARFVSSVRVLTTRDVNIEEIRKDPEP